MNIIYKQTEDLIPYANNPRNNSGAIDKVASSINHFGFKVPVIIDKKNEIICGHTRILAAKKLNMSEIPCIIADDLTETQIKAFRLADNKVAEYSEWNMELLDLELAELSELDFDMKEFDFGEVEKETEAEEPIDLDGDAKKDEDLTECHCPKCGFNFEVRL